MEIKIGKITRFRAILNTAWPTFFVALGAAFFLRYCNPKDFAEIEHVWLRNFVWIFFFIEIFQAIMYCIVAAMKLRSAGKGSAFVTSFFPAIFVAALVVAGGGYLGWWVSGYCLSWKETHILFMAALLILGPSFYHFKVVTTLYSELINKIRATNKKIEYFVMLLLVPAIAFVVLAFYFSRGYSIERILSIYILVFQFYIVILGLSSSDADISPYLSMMNRFIGYNPYCSKCNYDVLLPDVTSPVVFATQSSVEFELTKNGEKKKIVKTCYPDLSVLHPHFHTKCKRCGKVDEWDVELGPEITGDNPYAIDTYVGPKGPCLRQTERQLIVKKNGKEIAKKYITTAWS